MPLSSYDFLSLTASLSLARFSTEPKMGTIFRQRSFLLLPPFIFWFSNSLASDPPKRASETRKLSTSHDTKVPDIIPCFVGMERTRSRSCSVTCNPSKARLKVSGVNKSHWVSVSAVYDCARPLVDSICIESVC